MTLAIDFTEADIEAALRTLTAAQRRTVRAGTLDMRPGYWPLRAALIDKGMMTTANRLPVLTPFGRAVQARIRGQEQ